MKKKSKDYNTALRSKAEELLKSTPHKESVLAGESDVLKLIHELEVHQIELFLQNEELVRAKSDSKKIADKYIQLYDFAPSGYLTLNESGRIENLNLTCAKMLGIERQKILTKPFIRYVSQKSKVDFWNFLGNTFKNNEKSVCDIVLTNNSGQDINAHLAGILSEDSNNCQVTITDKTSELNALKLLDTSVHFKDLILRGAGEGIMGIDRKGNHLFVNPMAAKLLGYSEEELLGKPSHELYHHHYPDGTVYPVGKCPIHNTSLSGKSYRGEEYFWTKAGICFPVELSCLSIIDHDELSGTVVTFSDITQRKERESELIANHEKILMSEADLKKAQSAARLGSWKWDVTNGEVTWSDEMYKIFGIEKNGYTGRLGDAITKVIHPDDLYLVLPSNAENFTKKKPIEYRIILPENSVRYISAESGENITDKNGKILFMTGIAQDITERKLSEQNLSLFKTVIESSDEAISINNSSGELVYMNRAHEKLFGFTFEEVRGAGFGINFPPESINIIKTEIAPLLNQGISWEGEIEVINKAGRQFPIWVRTGIVEDTSGNKIYNYGFGHDISEKVKAEEARLQSEKILKTRLLLSEFSFSHTQTEIQRQLLDELEVLTGSTLGLFHIVNEDQESMTLQTWSSNTIMGMSKSPKKISAKIPLPEVWKDCINEKKTIIHNNFQEIAQRSGMPAGHSVIKRELVAPVVRNDIVVAIVGIGNKSTDYDANDVDTVTLLADMAWDISERKGAEERLSELNSELEERIKERTSQLVAVNKEIEAFAYSVSHDLRAPLRHIAGFVRMLKEIESPCRTGEEIKYLDMILNGAEEMGKLIDALLSFSKIQRTDINKTVIKTTDLIKSVIGFLSADINERKIDFRLGNIPDCLGDEQLIKMVWINLISNALKYTSKNVVAEIDISCIENDNENMFFIRDNGVGFDMKYAGKLFGVFQRLHHQRDFEGIGIGLANVNSIITRHGGSCRAEGIIDSGATFYFSLPK